MADLSLKCKKIRSPRGTRVTEIEWGDGHQAVYPHEFLRGYCPCAACQGHSGSIQYVERSGDSLQLENIEVVGNYALSFEWFDGHNSGLYSYKYLRALCQCNDCRKARSLDGRPELERA